MRGLSVVVPLLSAALLLVAAPARAECDASDPPSCVEAGTTEPDAGQPSTSDGGAIKTPDGGSVSRDPGFGTSEQASGAPSGSLPDLPPPDQGCATTSGSTAPLVVVPVAIGLLFSLWRARRRQPTKAPRARKRS